MLTDEQRALVRSSWAKVTPIADTAASLFYHRLFTLDPELRALFAHADMQQQGKKLLQMIDVAVKQLDQLGTLVPAVAALGRRHEGYGVQESHYATVGAALLWTLEQGLGSEFTPDVQRAWGATYVMLTDAMRSPAGALT